MVQQVFISVTQTACNPIGAIVLAVLAIVGAVIVVPAIVAVAATIVAIATIVGYVILGLGITTACVAIPKAIMTHRENMASIEAFKAHQLAMQVMRDHNFEPPIKIESTRIPDGAIETSKFNLTYN